LVNALGSTQKVNLYTYGSPRPGDEEFGAFVNTFLTGQNMRAVFKDDPVTTVPGHGMGFRHVGRKVHFHNT